MTPEQIKALVEEIQAHWSAFQTESRNALEEIKARGEVSPETTLRVDELGQKVANVQAKLAEIEASAARPRAGAAGGLSLGRQFVDSPEFQNWFKANAPGGRIPDGRVPVQVPPVQVPGPFALLPPRYRNALLTGGSATSAGALITPDDSGILVPFGTRDLTVLDLITMGSTDSDSVDYVRVTAQTNNAAGVAEATATADPSPMDAAHGVKPESDMALERVNAPVQTIAHWIAITKRALSDAGQLRTMIDAFLRQGVKEELENHAINGSGTGEEIEGFETAITLDQPYSAVMTAVLDPLLETTRKAMTKVMLAHSRPMAFLFNPLDWEKIELARMAKNPANEGTGGGVPTLHGRPVAQNEEVTEGIGYVGDFRQYVIWDREQAAITASNSHANFFIRNLVALLGELRAAGGLLKTDAICRIDLTP